MAQFQDIRQFNGGLNLDMDPRMLPDGDYLHALNLNIGTTEENNIGSVENVKGNQEVFGYASNVGDKVIGSVQNNKNNSIIFFIANALFDPSRIIEYNLTTSNIEIILESNLLGFTVDSPINHANIIDDELFWVDDLNNPGNIDIERAKGYTVVQGGGAWTGREPYTQITLETIRNGATPPLTRPDIEFIDDPTLSNNLLRDATYRFRAGYIYKNGQQSALSPISEVPIRSVNIINVDQLLIQNKIQITTFAGNKDLVKYVVLYVQKNNGVFAEFKRIKTEDIPGVNVTDEYIGNEVLRYIDDKLSNKIYDLVPIKAACQEFIGETHLIYGNIQDGYDKIENLDASIEFVKTAIDQPVELETKDVIYKTFKRRGVFSFGIIYKDYFGRTSGVLSDSNLDISMPRAVEDFNFGEIKDLFYRYVPKITISHEPPSWAEFYQVVVTQNQNEINYIQFVEFGNIFKRDGDSTFIQFESLNQAIAYNISVGDRFYVHREIVPSSVRLGGPLGDRQYQLQGDVNRNFVTISKIEGGKYYFESTLTEDFTSLQDANYYLMEVATPRKSEDQIAYYEIGNALRVEQDFISQKYYHTGDVDQAWTPSGALINPAEYSLVEDGDTYITIKKVDKTISSRGRKHVAVFGSTGPFGQGDPSIEIDGIRQDFSPFNDLTKYLLNPSSVKWFGSPVDNPLSGLNSAGWTSAYDSDNALENKLTATSPINYQINSEDPINVYFTQDVRALEVYESPNLYFTDTTTSQNDLGRIALIDERTDVSSIQTTKLIFSNRYFEGTEINGLGAFDFDDVEYLSETFGPLVRIITLSETLKCIQFRKLTSIYINRQEMQNADGTTQLIYSNRLLGQLYGSRKPFGTYHPESVTRTGNFIYFFDALHGKVVRAGEQGTEEPSDNGMRTYFRDFGREIYRSGQPYKGTSKVIMAWDLENENVIISLKDGQRKETLSFSETDSRWKSFYNYYPDYMAYSGLNFISSINGRLFLHNEGDRSTFYGDAFPSELTACFRKEFPRIKVFLSMRISSNKRWEVPEISVVERWVNNSNSDYEQKIMSLLGESDFENADGAWVAAFKKNMLSPGYDSVELALINGDEIIADSLIVTLRYNYNDEVVMNHVMVESNDNNFNY